MTATIFSGPAGIASLLAYIPDVTLVHFVETRFLVAVVIFARLTYVLRRHSNDKLLSFALAGFGVVYLFWPELNYAINSPSVLYLAVGIELAILSLKDDDNKTSILILSFALITLYPPLIINSLALSIYFFVMFEDERFDRRYLFIVAIVIIATILMVIAPRPGSYTGDIQSDIEISLANPFTPKPSMDYRGFLNFDQIFRHFPVILISSWSVVVAVIIGFIKYYGVAFLAIDRTNSSSIIKGSKVTIRGLEIYLLMSFLSIVLLRNSQHQTWHQLHLTTTIVSASIVYIILVASSKGAGLWRAGLMGVFLCSVGASLAAKGINHDPTGLFVHPKRSGGVYFDEFKNVPPSQAKAWIMQGEGAKSKGLRAIVMGKRLRAYIDANIFESAMKPVVASDP